MTVTDKFEVLLYCKIYTDTYPTLRGEATGEELYNFLIASCGHAFDGDTMLEGDLNIWYLGCNEKFGEIHYKDKVWKWGHYESSFANVFALVNAVYKDGHFTDTQYVMLLSKIMEAVLEFNDMYHMVDYLRHKRDNIPWVNTEGVARQEEFKKLVSDSKEN